MRILRLLYFLFLITGLMLSSPGNVSAQETPRVDVLTFSGPVTPVLLNYLDRGIERAATEGAAALVLELDTPGGSVEITKQIVQRISSAQVPVIVYVAPRGAQAGSAGTFITLAGHAAVMAPGTSIGAASPVAGEGQELPDTVKEKITNILAADIENLAKRRGEQAVEWAVKAVEEAAAATADRALELGVIDAVAQSREDLLVQLHGFEVELLGQPHVLELEGAVLNVVPMNPFESFLNFITNPTLAAILLTLGLQGILLELSNPGSYVPGIVGVIALVLAFFALGAMDANWAGLAFIALAFILFLLDTQVASGGVLTIGGIISFVLGAALLFDTPYFDIPWFTIISLATITAAFFAFVVSKAIGAQRRPAYIGAENLTGSVGVARSELAPTGKVFFRGEYWTAEAEDGPIPAGTPIEVIGREGFRLRVRRRQR